MLYTTIDNQWQLRDWFIKYDRDYFTPAQYEAIYRFYAEDSEVDHELDVIGICCDLTTSTWEELQNSLDIYDKDDIINALDNLTLILHYDEDGVLYYNY